MDSFTHALLCCCNMFSPSVTVRYCVRTDKRVIKILSLTVSLKYIPNDRGINYTWNVKICQFYTDSLHG